MNPTAVLHELRELKESWRKQSFKFTNEQSKRYSELLEARRERVKSFYEDGLVSSGGGTK
tara:strand:+ start:819 stop:998 length:180 start_codon:yes stop_codon:yes gene_type:complete